MPSRVAPGPQLPVSRFCYTAMAYPRWHSAAALRKSARIRYRCREELVIRIAIASDHAAFALKAVLAAWLAETGHDVLDLGPDSDARVDYPDFGYKLATAIAGGAATRGIALCGSGIGISIALNRHPAVRCALVGEPYSAMLAREHNDANVIALGARLTGEDMAKACIAAFLAAAFAGGRHAGRIDKLSHPQFEELAQ